jgi:hypothetical protein
MVAHNDAVTVWPFPLKTYQTPGLKLFPLQLFATPSAMPVSVASIVDPAKVCPHAIGWALQITSLAGG